jgi:hypothetical protein
VGAVSLQVILLGLRMVATSLVILASRGRAYFFLHSIEADPRVGIPIGEEAGRSKGSLSFPRYMFNNRARSFVHVQDETSTRLRNDR